MQVLNGFEVLSFSELCKKTDTKSSRLRYIDNVIGLDIITDVKNTRWFCASNIEKVKNINSLSKQGYKLEHIKNLLAEKTKETKKKDIIPTSSETSTISETTGKTCEVTIPEEDSKGIYVNLIRMPSNNNSLELFINYNELSKVYSESMKELDEKINRINNISNEIFSKLEDISEENKVLNSNIIDSLENRDIELVTKMKASMEERALAYQHNKELENSHKNIFSRFFKK